MKYHCHQCTVDDMRPYLGSGAFILCIYPDNAKRINDLLATIPDSCVLAIVPNDRLRDYFSLANTHRATAVMAKIGQHVQFSGSIDEPFVHTIDWFCDQYIYPIDMMICLKPSLIPAVVVGGVRSISETKYLLFAKRDGLEGFLPNHNPLASYGDTILFKNKSMQ